MPRSPSTSRSAAHSISPAKLEANRRNALQSTGPKTAQGKLRSRDNAITHGVYSQQILVNDEDPQQLHEFRCAMLRRLNPRDILELQLAERIIFISWRMRRIGQAEVWIYHRIKSSCQAKLIDRIEEKWRSLQNKERSLSDSIRRCRRPEGIQEMQQELQQVHEELEQTEQLRNQKEHDVLTGELTAKMFKSDLPQSSLERLHRYERSMENSLQRLLKELRLLREQPEEEPGAFVQAVLEQEERQHGEMQGKKELQGQEQHEQHESTIEDQPDGTGPDDQARPGDEMSLCDETNPPDRAMSGDETNPPPAQIPAGPELVQSTSPASPSKPASAADAEQMTPIAAIFTRDTNAPWPRR